MHTNNDKYYIDEVINGNTSVYKQLIEKHQLNVINIIFKITQNNEDAEELAQDVFIKVFNLLKTFKADSKFSTWLYRIAYNAAISHVRKKKIIQMPIQEEILEIETAQEFFNDFEDINNLKHEFLPIALAKLTPKDQALISMYYQQNLSTSEIAEITDETKSNVKIKLYRSRKQLFTYISNMIRPLQSVS